MHRAAEHGTWNGPAPARFGLPLMLTVTEALQVANYLKEESCGAGAAPLVWWKPGEGEHPVARLLQALGTRAVPPPPVAQEDLAPLLICAGRGRGPLPLTLI